KEAAGLGMNGAAARLYGLALEHAGALPAEEQLELYENCAVATQGDPARSETIRARRRAAEVARAANLPLREGYNLAVLSTSLDMIDQTEEAQGALQQALAILEPLAPNRGLVTVYKNLAYRSLQQGDAPTAVTYAEKSVEMAHWTEKEHIIIGATQMLGLCWLPLDHARGCEHLEHTLQMALDNDVYWTAAATYPNLTM